MNKLIHNKTNINFKMNSCVISALKLDENKNLIAIAKLAKSSESGEDATIFVTHAPCMDCAKLIYQSGINSVYYRNTYKNEDGLKFLEKCNIKVERI